MIISARKLSFSCRIPTKFVHFKSGRIFGVAITFLKQTNEPLALAVKLVGIVICEFDPLVADFAENLFSFAFKNIVCHVYLLRQIKRVEVNHHPRGCWSGLNGPSNTHNYHIIKEFSKSLIKSMKFLKIKNITIFPVYLSLICHSFTLKRVLMSLKD